MSNIQESITSITKEHDARRHLAVIVCMIAVATVLAVFWSLHINGITLSSGDLTCGMEEHTHTSDCYAWVPVEDETERVSGTEDSAESETASETEESTDMETTTGTGFTGAAEGNDTEAASETVTESATESVSTETGTEALTEDGSETLTEEETEVAQVGDTKVINGVEYVYTLICEMEEHTHTDECYADEEDSEETETEETASASSLNAGVATITSYGISMASEEGGNSGIATASEEGSGTAVTSLTATNGTGSDDPSDYNLAYTVDGLPESGDYIIYMYDSTTGYYYVLEADGSLTQCTTISSITEATNDGPYYVTGTGVIVYGTTTDGTSAYSAAQWTATQDSSDSSKYTIEAEDSDSNTVYLAPTGTSEDMAFSTGFSEKTGYVTLSGDFELTYTFTNTGNEGVPSGTKQENWFNYVIEINNGGTNGTNGGAVYIDVRSDYAGWLAYNTDGATLTFQDGINDWSTWLSTMNAGTKCTVTITRSGNTFYFTCYAAGETFTAYVTATDFDGYPANVYLTGEYCKISDISYYFDNTVTDQTSGTSVTSTLSYGEIDSAVVRSAYSSTVTLTAASAASTDSGKTGVEISHSMLTSVLTESPGTAAWEAGGTGTTFYFARTVTTSSDDYYFSEAITLTDAAANWQDDSYVVYTQINGVYYLVSAADGSLLECTDLSNYTDDQQKALLSEEAGVYIWEFDSDGEPVFKFTSETDSNTADFDDYWWTLTADGDSVTGTGDYTVYNDENGKYLSAGLYAESISGSETQTYESAGEITGYGTMVFSITDMEQSGGQYYLQIKVADKTTQTRYVRPVLRALRDDAWVASFPSETLTTGYTSTTEGGMTLNGDRTDGVANTLTITVTTSENGVTITYLNADGETLTYTASGTGYYSTGAIVTFWTTSGSYKITPISSNISSYVRTSLNSDAITLTAVDGANSGTAATGESYYWTAESTANSADFSLIGQRETANDTGYEIEWVEDGSASAGGTATGTATSNVGGTAMTTLATSEYIATTFSFARVKNNFVWFDGTNGGMASYSSNTSVTAYDEIMVIPYDAYGNAESITTPKSITDASGYGSTTYGGYSLRGWYDIYNGNYYEPGEKITLTSSTVMYADWEVASYDIGENASLAGAISTNNFITTKLFDYNELFDLQGESLTDSVTRTTESNSVTYSMTEYRTRTLSGHRELYTLNSASSIALGSSSLGFIFFRTETTPFYYTDLDKSVNGYNPLVDFPDGRASTINASSGTVTQGIFRSYGTKESDVSLLTTLFGTGNTVDDVNDPGTDSFVLGKTYVGTADYLFQYDSASGYYYYNSEKNAASYNASAERFYVYGYTIKADATGSTDDFLPFNYGTSGTTITANNVNYWFGMSTTIEFYLPDDVGTTNANPDITGNHHMTFKFSGDDDVWVFVDGVLVLDLGGVHGQVYGEIDFSTGEVVVVNSMEADDGTKYVDYDNRDIIDYTAAAISAGAVIKQPDAETIVKNLKSGSHTLTFYYLERGASQSNAAIYTNVSSTTYNLNLAKVDASTNATSLDGAEFTFYTDNTFTTLANLEKSDGTSASTFSMPSETACGLVEGTLYYVVETKAPDGYTAAGKYFTVLLESGILTIKVYDSSGTDPLETYQYKINYDTTYLTYSLELRSSSPSSDWNYIVNDSNSYSVTASVSQSGAVEYYSISLTVANTTGYEIPSAGGTGFFTGLEAGMTLILIALAGFLMRFVFQIVWKRRVCAIANERYYRGDKIKFGNTYARMRGHPRERSITRGHARDRPGDT